MDKSPRIFYPEEYDAGALLEKPHGMRTQRLAHLLSKILNFERWRILENV